MKEAQKEPVDVDALLYAVRLNWRLWTIFQAEMTSPECPLPRDIHLNMLSLCNFVDKTAVDIISDPKPEKLDILISLNREIAGGLFATPPTAPPPAKTEEQSPPTAPTGSVDRSA